MVLWKIGEDDEVAGKICGRRNDQESPQVFSKERRRRGFKPDALTGSTTKPECNHIRLRGVGYPNIENCRASRKPDPLGRNPRLERLNHHEHHDPDHQQCRYLIDNTIESLSYEISIGGKITHT